MGKYYILDGKKVVAVSDVKEWGRWYTGADKKVGNYQGGDVGVSTVFLGSDHQFGEGPPLIFETMIFGGKYDGYTDRYSTWEEAEAGHEKAVKLVT